MKLAKYTQISESEAEVIIDSQLIAHGWVLDPRETNRNVYKQRARTDQQNRQLAPNRPDYVLYAFEDSNQPTIVIEAKRPHVALSPALKEGVDKYALKLNAPIVIATNGGQVKTWNVVRNEPLFLDGREVDELFNPEMARRFVTEKSTPYTFYNYTVEKAWRKRKIIRTAWPPSILAKLNEEQQDLYQRYIELSKKFFNKKSGLDSLSLLGMRDNFFESADDAYEELEKLDAFLDDDKHLIVSKMIERHKIHQRWSERKLKRQNLQPRSNYKKEMISAARMRFPKDAEKINEINRRLFGYTALEKDKNCKVLKKKFTVQGNERIKLKKERRRLNRYLYNKLRLYLST